MRDRRFKGVAGGIAAASDVDATLIRILFAVAGLSGWGVVAYIILCFALKVETVEEPARPLPNDQRLILRVGLGAAAVVSAGRIFDGWIFGNGQGGPGWGLILIGIGAAVLWTRRDSNRDPRPPAESAWPDPDPMGVYGDMPPWNPPVAAPFGAGIDWRSTGRDLLRLAGAFVAVWAFLALIGGTLLVGSGAVRMRMPFLPAAIGSLGLLALVFAVVKKARVAGLVVAGLVLLLASGLALGLTSLPGGSGDKAIVVADGQPIAASYRHGAGRLALDLRNAKLGSDDQSTKIRLGAGQLTITVPAAASVEVKTQIGAGAMNVFGARQEGPGLNTVRFDSGAPGAGKLTLDIEVGLGELVVARAPEPTFKVSCVVPPSGEVTEGSPVDCRRPNELIGVPMDCAVSLVDPYGGQPGRAFCRRQGAPPIAPASFSVTCAFGDVGNTSSKCTSFSAAQRAELGRAKAASAPPTVPSPGNRPAGDQLGGTAPTDGMRFICGDTEPDGTKICTRSPASTSPTTKVPTIRCREDPATKETVCPVF